MVKNLILLGYQRSNDEGLDISPLEAVQRRSVKKYGTLYLVMLSLSAQNQPQQVVLMTATRSNNFLMKTACAHPLLS